MNCRKAIVPLLSLCLLAAASCEEEHEHTAPAIHDRDSVAAMVSYGINTLISDSGVIKYRIVAERWEVNDKRNPSRWIFEKGLLLTQFDLKKHVLGYITCDTAYYFDQDRRWELHGRVRIHTKDSVDFQSEELYWDEQKHEVWSHRYSHIKTPDREMEGSWFKSDERMTQFEIRQAKGSFERGDMGRDKPKPNPADSTKTDSTKTGTPAAKNNTPATKPKVMPQGKKPVVTPPKATTKPPVTQKKPRRHT